MAALSPSRDLGPAQLRQTIANRCQCRNRRRPPTPYVWGGRPPVRPSEEPRWPGAHQRRWAREVSRKSGDGPPEMLLLRDRRLPARPAKGERNTWPGAHQRRWAREVSAPGRCRRRHRRGQERRGLVVVVVSDEEHPCRCSQGGRLGAEEEGEASLRLGRLSNRRASAVTRPFQAPRSLPAGLIRHRTGRANTTCTRLPGST